MKTALITGISGQDGSLLAKFLLDKGYQVIGQTRNTDDDNLKNIRELGIEKKITLEEGNLLDQVLVSSLIDTYQPNEVYNCSSQSSLAISFKFPTETIHANLIIVMNLLEKIRRSKLPIRFFQPSSCEMYSDPENLPITERTPIHPQSPYSVAKAAAHWLVINYRKTYGIYGCCGILFNHESNLRSPRFLIMKIIKESINIKNGHQDYLTLGNVDVIRDYGYAPYYVEAFWKMLQLEKATDFVICSGNRISMKEIIYHVFKKLSIDKNKLKINPKLFRPIDIKEIYGDNSKARKILNWQYDLKFTDALDIMINKELELK